MAAEVSFDEHSWASALIINHTSHGAMIESGLTGKTGDTLKIRYSLPDGSLIATGNLNHILLGDREQPMGIGIHFRKDENWVTIHNFLKSPETVNDSDTPCPPSEKNKPGDKQLNATPESVSSVLVDEDANAVDLTKPPFSPNRH